MKHSFRVVGTVLAGRWELKSSLCRNGNGTDGAHSSLGAIDSLHRAR